jgi:hypothetical protein
MAFHTFAYTASLGAVTDADVIGVPDTVLAVDSGGHPIMRSPMRLLMAWAGGILCTRFKLHSGQLSYQGDPQIIPFDASTSPVNNPNVMLKFKNELVLPLGEGLQVLASTSGAGPTRTTVVLVAADASIPLPNAMRPDKLVSQTLGYSDSDREVRGNIFPVRLTSTVAATANLWSQLVGVGGLAYQVSLPGGVWEVYCSTHQSATAQAHRWVFPFDPLAGGSDRPLFRPGWLSLTAINFRTDRLWYMYPYGSLGKFLSDVPPTLEVLCNGADAVHEVYQWIRKINT